MCNYNGLVALAQQTRTARANGNDSNAQMRLAAKAVDHEAPNGKCVDYYYNLKIQNFDSIIHKF